MQGAINVEKAGFDSIWVRDHVLFRPHGHEAADPTLWEPLVTLGAVAGVTERLTVASGAIIPYRHPLQTALAFATLDQLTGGGRVILGMGLGTFDHEFAAVGMGGWDRRQVLEEQVEIFRKIWAGKPVTHSGRYYNFEDGEIHPTPLAGDLPVWYSGSSPASARRAAEYCDGWIPGRMPLRDMRKRIARMRRLAEQANRPVPHIGSIPYVVPGRTFEEAMRGVDVQALAKELAPRYMTPESGRWDSLEDTDGAIIAGPPEVIIEEVRRAQEVGALHFVFDLRLRFDEWQDCISLLAEEVLPELRRGDPPGQPAMAAANARSVDSGDS